MKKVNLIPFLFGLCLLFTSTMAIAQGYLPLEADDGNPCGGCPIPADHRYFMIPNVHVANLNNFNTGPSPLGTYSLPLNAEKMFLEFSGLGTTLMFPVSEFTLWDEYNGYEIFRSISQGSFAVYYYEFCDHKVGTIESEFTWRIVNASGDDYPIQEPFYSNPDGIYSCHVFDATCHQCNPNCEPKALNISISYPISVNCDAVGTLELPGLNKHVGNGSAINFNQLSSFPNPIDDRLNLEYSTEQTTNVNLTIFNTQGQIMVNSNKEEEAGFHQKTFDTSAWPNGIYYGKIEFDGRSEVIKVIKLD